MPTTEAGKRLLRRMTTRDTQDLTPSEAAIDAIEAEVANNVVAAWEPIADKASAVERERIRPYMDTIREALRIGAICFNGDSWFVSRDAIGDSGYDDLDDAEKVLTDARAAVLAIIDGEKE